MCEKETDHSDCSQLEEGLVPRSSSFDITFPKAVMEMREDAKNGQ